MSWRAHGVVGSAGFSNQAMVPAGSEALTSSPSSSCGPALALPVTTSWRPSSLTSARTSPAGSSGAIVPMAWRFHGSAGSEAARARRVSGGFLMRTTSRRPSLLRSGSQRRRRPDRVRSPRGPEWDAAGRRGPRLQILEPKDGLFTSRGGEQINVPVAVKIRELGGDRVAYGQQYVSAPSGSEGVFWNLKPRDGPFRVSFHCRVVAGRTVSVRGNKLGPAVTVKIGDRDADERAAGREIGYDPCPAPAPNRSSRVLEVKQMPFFTCRDKIGETVRIEVRHSGVSHPAGLGTLSQRKAEPFAGIV